MNAIVSLIKPLYCNVSLSMELSCLYFKRLFVKVSIKRFISVLEDCFHDSKQYKPW